MNELLQPTPDYLIEQDNDRWRQGRRAQRYLAAVEFVLLFTPRLVGKNAGVHPAARGIVPLLRSAYPQSAATMRWWIFLDDFVQYGSSSFDAMSDRQDIAEGAELAGCMKPRRRPADNSVLATRMIALLRELVFAGRHS